jgi:hypothetical protein
MALPDLHDPAVMQLLALCTARGVTVTFVPAPAQNTTTASRQAAGQRPAGLAREPWSTLIRARLDALTNLFPHWHIWLDHSGWHARHRGDHLQGYRPGAPAFHVTADTATELAAQICWRQAADTMYPTDAPTAGSPKNTPYPCLPVPAAGTDDAGVPAAVSAPCSPAGVRRVTGPGPWPDSGLRAVAPVVGQVRKVCGNQQSLRDGSLAKLTVIAWLPLPAPV